MWKYEKKLEYPVNINKKNLKLAKAMLIQYGGPYFKRDTFKERNCVLCNVNTLEKELIKENITFIVPY